MRRGLAVLCGDVQLGSSGSPAQFRRVSTALLVRRGPVAIGSRLGQVSLQDRSRLAALRTVA